MISRELEAELRPAFDAVMANEEIKMVGNPVGWYAQFAPFAVSVAVQRAVHAEGMWTSCCTIPSGGGITFMVIASKGSGRWESAHPNIAIAALDAYTQSLAVKT